MSNSSLTENYLAENPQNEIIKFSSVINGDKFFEARLLGTPRGIISGYFDDPVKLDEEVSRWNGSAQGIYVTMNTLMPELRERIDNKLHDHAKVTTSDDNVARYDWIPIDIDPVRPSGLSSTQGELDAALSKATQIKRMLGELGWPVPVELMSGNGVHLLYKVDLENNKGNRELVRRVLEYLDASFSDEAVKVDTSVFNPSRIIKLSGTLVCKGFNRPERPHRTSRILKVPEAISQTPLEKLYELASHTVTCKQPETDRKPNSEFKSLDEFREWLTENGVNIIKEKPYKDGILLVPDVCPFNAEHTNRSAYIIWFANGHIVVGCHHDSCQGKDYYAFRKSMDDDWEPFEKGKATKASKVLELIQEAQLFLNQLKEPFVRMNIKGHNENHPLDGTTYRDWLSYEYYKRHGSTMGSDTLNQVIPIARSIARFEGSEHETNVRVGKTGDYFYYDLVDNNWHAVKISPDGWEIVLPTDVYFRRYSFMCEQSTPVKGPYGIQRFLEFVNLKKEEERQLLLVYLVCCLVPDISKVIAIFHGEKGSSKSTTMRLIRKLIDPSVEELLNLPREDRSIVLTLNNNYMPAFDNLDVIKDAQSDYLCRACTGGAFSFRKYFTDSDEVIFKIKRCIMVNGINLVAEKTDLIDRSITFELDRISEDRRREEGELYEEFERVKPYILADMFDILSRAMKIHPEVSLPTKSRMADWERWAYAVAEVMGIGGEKLVEYFNKNRALGNDQVLNTNPLTSAVMTYMQTLDSWQGTLGDFHQKIDMIAANEHIETFNRHWPKSPNKVSAKLKLVKSNLLEAGIDYIISQGKEGNFKNRAVITIKKMDVTLSRSADILAHDTDTAQGQSLENVIDSQIVATQSTDKGISFDDIL